MATKIVFLSLQNTAPHSANFELGFSDGTPGGATILDLYPGLDGSMVSNASRPEFFTQFGDKIIFQATTAADGRELWITDGSPGGTSLLKDINTVAPTATHSAFFTPTNFGSDNQPGAPLVVNGTMYFSADDGVHGFELWKTNGTSAGTEIVKDINTSGVTGSSPTNFVNLNGTLYFLANDGTNGPQIWKSNGTDAGTTRVTDLPHPAGANILTMVVSGNLIYLVYYDGTANLNSQQVYVTDGTFGTEHLLSPSHPAILEPRNLTDINGTLYFTMNDGQNGFEIWKSNGTDAGTVLVKDIYDDGTHGSGAPSSVPFGYHLFNGEVYFGATDGVKGTELWKTNGTAAGTSMVKDINTDPSGPGTETGISDPFALVEFNGELYFTASDGIQAGKHNIELWKTNGTPGGTVMVADLSAGNGPGTPTQLKVIDGVLYFGANAVGGGFGQLYRYDGVNPPQIISENYHFGDRHQPFSFILQSPPSALGLDTAEVYTEDTPLNLADIVVSDADSANVTVTLKLSVPAAGSLNTGTSGAVTSTYNPGTGTWEAIGAIADVNTLLAALMFTPAADFNANFTIATSVTDGVSTPVTGTKVMTGVPVNDAPEASGLNTAEVYTEDTALNLADIVVSDIDSANVTVTLTLSNPSAGSLNTGNSGAVISTYNAVAGVWSANGAIADVNTLLAALTFTPAPNSSANFTIATSVSDGVAPPVTGTKVMTGTAVNDDPVITSNGGGAAANLNRPENATAVTTVTATDPDGPSLTFSIIGGSDAAKFQINASTGELKFVNAPNFEAPSDSDANNSYVVQVRASDSIANDDQIITVNVTDVAPELAKGNDFNADGSADIFWEIDSGPLALWQMNGTQIGLADYTRLGSAQVNRPGSDWHVVDTGDFNGDARADIFWRTDSGALALWEMDGNKVKFADYLRSGSSQLNAPGPDWHVLGTLDADGDSRSDILWRTDSGALAIWTMNGNQLKGSDYIRLGATAVGVPGPDWHIVGDGDFDGDGKEDILWQTDSGALALWLLDGTHIKSAQFLKNGASNVGVPGSDWHVSDVADFDGDGKADILWRTGGGHSRSELPPGGGSVAIWEMDGNQLKLADFTRVGSSIVGAPGPDWHLLGADDYNHDGKADLLWQTDSNALAIWQMDGTHVTSAGFTKLGAATVGVPGSDWHIYQHHYDLV